MSPKLAFHDVYNIQQCILENTNFFYHFWRTCAECIFPFSIWSTKRNKHGKNWMHLISGVQLLTFCCSDIAHFFLEKRQIRVEMETFSLVFTWKCWFLSFIHFSFPSNYHVANHWLSAMTSVGLCMLSVAGLKSQRQKHVTISHFTWNKSILTQSKQMGPQQQFVLSSINNLFKDIVPVDTY